MLDSQASPLSAGKAGGWKCWWSCLACCAGGSGGAARRCGGTASTGPPALWRGGRKELSPPGWGCHCLHGPASVEEDVPSAVSKKRREVRLPLWMLEVAEEEAIPHATQ